MKKILIVLSAADTWIRTDGSRYPTGFWAEEFVVVHEKFIKAGYSVDLTTPEGKIPTADPHSLNSTAGPDWQHYAQYLKDIAKDVNNPLVLSDVNANEYDAIVVPGGHGPVIDLYKDVHMGRVIVAAYKANKIIASVCHGPAALLTAFDMDNKWLFVNRKITAFSDEEEVEFGTAQNAPWLLATALRKYGANYVRSNKNWEPFVVRDGHLISGQNPASSAPMAEAVIQAFS